MSTYKVVAAAYGALADGNPDQSQASDVTSTLQGLLDRKFNDGNVPINDTTFGDPANKFTKHFGAVVIVDGKSTAFACEEGQTIDFN